MLNHNQVYAFVSSFIQIGGVSFLASVGLLTADIRGYKR